MERSAVEFSGVSVILGGKKVLKKVDWVVREGERWAIVGPNGCGKTTLLKVVNGYLRPFEGKASILERDFVGADLREMRKKIGLVSSYLHELISSDQIVLDIVLSGKEASSRVWEKPEEEDFAFARRLLSIVGCRRYEEKQIKDLSQGERQKVLIARALMARPKLIALDEPCAELDIKGRETFLKGLANAAKRSNLTMLYVTHRIDEIPEYFGHALLLKEGRVVTQGPISQVLTSRNLSRCFDTDIKVNRVHGRFYAIA